MYDVIVVGAGAAAAGDISRPSQSDEVRQERAGAASAHVEVDPVLEQQLKQASDDQLVEAVLVLRREAKNTQSAIDPGALLARVRGNVRPDTIETNYLPRLGILIVRARPDIIRRLLAQPEIEIASANQAEVAASAVSGA